MGWEGKGREATGRQGWQGKRGREGKGEWYAKVSRVLPSLALGIPNRSSLNPGFGFGQRQSPGFGFGFIANHTQTKSAVIVRRST